MVASIEAIYMVEASPYLREAQKMLLCGQVEMEQVAIGHRARCQYIDVDITWCEDIKSVPKGKAFSCSYSVNW